MTPPRMILVSDNTTRAVAAVFGGPMPSWCLICSEMADFDKVPPNTQTRAFGLFYSKNSDASLLWDRLRNWQLVTPLSSGDVRGLKASLAKQGRYFGPDVADLMEAMAGAADAAREAA
jgi:hypothetical protein